MEGNHWYDKGYTGYRNHFGGDDQPINPDVYRGAYRLDTESRDRSITTYNGFDRYEQQQEHSRNYNRMPENYNQDQFRNYNDDREQQQRNNQPYNRQQNRAPQGYWRDEETQQPERLYRATHIIGNFESDYGRDRYNNYGSGENYGNMAGSLSWGYDGNYNSDPDENRYYNPLTGHRRSYHGNYTSRHPDREDEHTGRRFDRNDRDEFERYERYER
ncbi:MAG TPA: hypothetical protein VIG72_03735 [Pontibacter sp.]